VSLQVKFLTICVLAVSVFAQSENSIEFFDSTGTNSTAVFGWQGSKATGKFFIQTPNGKNVEVQEGNVNVGGTVTSEGFVGDGSGLTGVPTNVAPGGIKTNHIEDGAVTDAKIDSVDWAKVKNKPTIPSGSGGTTLSTGAVTSDHILNTTITAEDIADSSITSDKIDSVDWAQIKNIPADFKDGVDNVATGSGTAGVTSISVGDGLTATGTSGDVTVGVNFDTTATSVARGNHSHDSIRVNATNIFENANTIDSIKNAPVVNHNHDSAYYTKTEANENFLTTSQADQRYLTTNQSWCFYKCENNLAIDMPVSGYTNPISITLNVPSNGHVIITATTTIRKISLSDTGSAVYGTITKNDYFDQASDACHFINNIAPWETTSFSMTKGFEVYEGENTFNLLFKYYDFNQKTAQVFGSACMTANFYSKKMIE